MKNSPSRWNVAQATVCAGIVCIAAGFVGNCASVVYAQCANKTVREASPCVLEATVCRMVGSVCSSEGTDVHTGDFQCDWENSGTTCTGSGSMAPCQDKYACMWSTSKNACTQDPDGEATAKDAETLVEEKCAG
jgi:hypothetical protein